MTFLEHLLNRLSSKDLQHEDLTVVFPNKRAALYLREQFKKAHKGNVWMPQMMSIEEAVSAWSGIQLADGIDLLFELIAINTAMGHQGDSITTFGSMANQMAKDFDEVDQYAVDPSHLFSYIFEEKKIGTWHLGEQITPREQAYLHFFKQLKEYYEQLRHRLSVQGKGYYGMITRALAELDGETLRQKTEGRSIVFAGFNALTPTEQKIIDTLYKNGQVEVIWDFDRYYVDDPLNEAGWFARQYIRKDVPWKPTEFFDDLLQTSKEIHLVEATGNTIQAKALQSMLQADPENEATIILADEELLIPVLNSIPDDGKHDHINVSMGYPLSQTSLSHLVSEFFTLHRKGRKVGDRGWYIWPILRLLDLEVVKVIFSKEELDEIIRYREKVRKDSLFVYEETDFNSICSSPDLQQFMRLVVTSKEHTLNADEFLDALINLMRFIAQKVRSRGQANIFLLNQISETGKAVNRLKNVMVRYQHYVHNLDELEVLYRLISRSIAIKLNSSNTEGLQVMGILETRNLDFDTFYMIGVNEGVLPTDKANNSFIPFHIRRECGLPDYREKQAVYAYHFYRLLQRARKVHFVYNSNGNESGGEPSRFLMQLQHELAQRNPGITVVHESFVNKASQSQQLMPLTACKQASDLRELSPTSLSNYISCPLKYFLRYIMHIKEDRLEEEAQENDLGSVIHETLQLLYADQLDTVIDYDRFTQRIEPALSNKLQQAINTHYKQGLSNVGYNYLNQMGLNDMLKKYVQFEKRWVKSYDLSILQVEHKLEYDLVIAGKTFHLSGTADRIDRSNGMVRIIDYKTGTVKSENVKVPSEVVSLDDIPEKALQLMIYKYLYLKQHPETDPNMVTAAIFGLRYEQVIFDLNIQNQELREHFMETMDQLFADLLPELIDEELPYRQTDDPDLKPCKICDFSSICVNTSIGALQVDDR